MENDVLQRVTQLYTQLGLSKSSFAREINLKQMTVNQYLNGERKFSFEFIQAILMRYPELSAEWLLKGEGEIEVFAVTSNADPNSVLEIIVSVMIDDELDEDSYATITCTVGGEIVQKARLRYHNGNGAEGENGLMEATTDSEYVDDELLELPDALFEYIDDNLNPYVQKLEDEQDPYSSEGGSSIVADFPCEWCGKYGVSLDDSFYKVGYCCYCGSENSINVCAKCGRLYSVYDGDEHFCNGCMEKQNE